MLLVSFLVVESRVREPMVPLALFRDSRFTVSCGVYAIMYLALASTFFFVTLFFQNVEGWSALDVGLSWLIMNTPFLIASTLAGRLAVWIGTATCWLGVLLGGLGVLRVLDTRRRLAGGVARLRADRGRLRDGGADDLIRRGVGAAAGTQRAGLWRAELGSPGGYGGGTGRTRVRRASGHPQLLGSQLAQLPTSAKQVPRTSSRT